MEILSSLNTLYSIAIVVCGFKNLGQVLLIHYIKHFSRVVRVVLVDPAFIASDEVERVCTISSKLVVESEILS